MDVQPEGKKVTAGVRAARSTRSPRTSSRSSRTSSRAASASRPQPQPNQPGGVATSSTPSRASSATCARTRSSSTRREDDIARDPGARRAPRHARSSITNQPRARDPAEEPRGRGDGQVLQTLIDATTLFGSSGGSLGSISTRPHGTAARTPARSPGPPAPARPSPRAAPSNEEKPAVVADKASNSLIIAASKEQFDRLKHVIDADRRPEVAGADRGGARSSSRSTTRSASRSSSAGLDDNGLEPHGGPSGFGGTYFGQTEFADRDGDGYVHRPRPALRRRDGGAAPTGLVGGIFASGQVPFIFRVAQHDHAKTRVLQLPSIVTTDNEEATIRVLDEQATTEQHGQRAAATRPAASAASRRRAPRSRSARTSPTTTTCCSTSTSRSPASRASRRCSATARSPPTSSGATS